MSEQDELEAYNAAMADEDHARHGEDERDETPLDGSLTIRFLQYINVKRAERWHGLHSWSALEWAGAMAGEAGEACNAAKKLKRIETGIANINHEEGRSLTGVENASAVIVNEIADTVIYGVLLASRVGLDLEEAIRMKFNQKSEEYGFPERIPANCEVHRARLQVAQEIELERETRLAERRSMLTQIFTKAADVDALRGQLATAHQEIETLTKLLQRAKPDHFFGECMGACMDDEPEHCGTLRLIAEIEAALSHLKGATTPK